ncbi:YcaO-like family protein [Pseudomonas sp. P2757]|uniref:YcaO-like family protein n=1 Tax=unclassified Pseudomonas TaxID=196821 RepID=UPI003B5C4289
MDNTRIAERELTADQAQQRIDAELFRLGIASTTRTLGRNVVCVQAILRDSHGRQARGAGKGYAEHARLGALYETLEHYWSDDLRPADAHYQTGRYFSDTPLFADDSVLRLVAGQQNRGIACRTYTCPAQTVEFSYPLALTSPAYIQQRFTRDTTNYRALQRYASNSGTAIGASYYEAVLHAANECIERDALSLFLLNHFYYQNHLPLRRVARLDQSDSLGRSWADAEQEIGGSIVLLDISNEFKARTFLAFSSAAGALPRVFGTGCSLDARHAAWRALSELVQLHLAATQTEYRKALGNAQRHLVPFPRLLRCVRFDPHALLHVCPHREVTLRDPVEQTSLAEQVDYLLRDLHNHGRTPGVCILKQTELGTTLANVVIPGLERFFVVSSGNVVIPQVRGRRLEAHRR